MTLHIRFRPVRREAGERAFDMTTSAPDFLAAMTEFGDRFARVFPHGDIVSVQRLDDVGGAR